MFTHGMKTSLTSEWETPQYLFDKLNNIYHFELDVCANINNHKCDLYYDIEDNGLLQDWKTINWCNPPYGRKIGLWIEKAYLENKKGNTIILLLPARTDTKWFHKYIYNQHRIEFIKGRLKFNNQNKDAPFPSMIVYMENK